MSVLNDDWSLHSKFGHTMSLVNIYIHRSSKELRVVKKMRRTERAVQEITFLKFLKHPNIIDYLHIVCDQKNIHIVMKYYGETLCDFLARHDINPVDREICAKNIMSEINSGFKYLHSQQICHNDIKPQNILMCKPIKITDFGLSFNYNNSDAVNGIISRNNFTGTLRYMAPEHFTGIVHLTSDIWSLGAILYEILFNRMVNSKEDNISEIHKCIIINTTYISDNCEDLIRSMLTYNPDKRIKLTSYFDHRWYME